MLSKKDISAELGKNIALYPLHISNIKGNSINLTASHLAWSLSPTKRVKKVEEGRYAISSDATGTYEIKQGQSAVVKEGKNDQYIILLPHATTIIETSEVIGVGSGIGGTFHSKVGVVAHGIGDTATMLGPGFCGHLMISLHNITDSPYAIKVGDTFVSLVLHRLDTPVDTSNSNMSGHVDKLSELRIDISQKDREWLTGDWKCNFNGIKSKMTEAQEYIRFREEEKKQGRSLIRKYFTPRNAILFSILLACVIFLGFVMKSFDEGKYFDIYISVVFSSMIVPLIIKLGKQIRPSDCN